MSEYGLKREFHYFVLTDYEREEEYLRRMHKNGYRFVKVTLPGIYYFEKCAPEDVIYKLYFYPQKNGDRQEYLKIYEDYGWEYMQSMNEYAYFRKKASEADEERDLEIFSDEESKMEMLKRIFIKRMLPISCIFFCCVLPYFIEMFTGKILGYLGVGLTCLWVMIGTYYIFLMGKCCVGFYRLYKKYSRI